MCKNLAMAVPTVPHRVVVLALPGVVAFEVGLPHRFFAASALTPGGPDGREQVGAPYEVVLCTVDDGPVTTSAGFRVLPTHPNTELAHADTVVIPGLIDPALLNGGVLPDGAAALLGTARPGVRWLSICTGAFVLAALGLLDGQEATTHWVHADEFARHFPTVRLNRDVLYVDNGDVLTSAGNAAGIDLLLHVLRRDHGTAVANRVARGAVVAPWRSGGQAQFIQQPVPAPGSDGTGPTRAWVLERIAESISLSDMASHASMSVRTFTRRFREETGETAGSWLTRARVETARHLLESTEMPVDRVATAAGFGTTASLRQHLSAAVGLSPLAYRRTYRPESA